MALGLGVLGLAPRDFWTLTARELETIVRARAGGAGADVPTRGDLKHLMDAFPDKHE